MKLKLPLSSISRMQKLFKAQEIPYEIRRVENGMVDVRLLIEPDRFNDIFRLETLIHEYLVDTYFVPVNPTYRITTTMVGATDAEELPAKVNDVLRSIDPDDYIDVKYQIERLRVDINNASEEESNLYHTSNHIAYIIHKTNF